LLVGIGIAGLAVLMAVRGFRIARAGGHGADLDGSAYPVVERADWPRGSALRRTLIVTVIIAAYVVLLQFTGFLVATVLATTALVRLLSGWRIIPSVIAGVILPLAAYALFVWALGVRLP
jgi:hypothetical protein